MYDCMLYPELVPLTDEEARLVEENINLVWGAYHRWMSQLPLAHYPKDDIFSIGVLALIKAAKTYNPELTVFSSWATRLINNQFCTLRQYCRARVSVLDCTSHSDDIAFGQKDDDILYYSAETDTLIESIYLRDLLEKAGLTEREKKILYLGVGKGFSQGDVAKTVNISQSHVSRLQSKALKKLRGVKMQWNDTA